MRSIVYFIIVFTCPLIQSMNVTPIEHTHRNPSQQYIFHIHNFETPCTKLRFHPVKTNEQIKTFSCNINSKKRVFYDETFRNTKGIPLEQTSNIRWQIHQLLFSIRTLYYEYAKDTCKRNHVLTIIRNLKEIPREELHEQYVDDMERCIHLLSDPRLEMTSQATQTEMRNILRKVYEVLQQQDRIYSLSGRNHCHPIFDVFDEDIYATHMKKKSIIVSHFLKYAPTTCLKLQDMGATIASKLIMHGEQYPSFIMHAARAIELGSTFRDNKASRQEQMIAFRLGIGRYDKKYFNIIGRCLMIPVHQTPHIIEELTYLLDQRPTIWINGKTINEQNIDIITYNLKQIQRNAPHHIHLANRVLEKIYKVQETLKAHQDYYQSI